MRHELLSAAIDKLFLGDVEFERFGLGANNDPSDQVDFLLAVEDETHDPDGIFGQLRWGGQFIYVSRNRDASNRWPSDIASAGSCRFIMPCRCD